MPNWNPNVRRWRGEVHFTDPDGDTVGLSPIVAAAAGGALFDYAVGAEKRGCSVDLGRVIPALAGVVQPPAETFCLAGELFACACRLRAAGSVRVGYTTPTAVQGCDSVGPDHVNIRLAGGPTVKDLADLDAGGE